MWKKVIENLLGISVEREAEKQTTIYVPQHYVAEEFIDPDTLDYLRTRNVSPWVVMDCRALWTADAIWKAFNTGKWAKAEGTRKVTVNDWKWGGSRKYRGFRPADCAVGAKLSQHRFGRGWDYDVEGIAAEDVRREIMANQYAEPFKYITCIEDAVTWNHNDVRALNKAVDGILIVRP